MPVRIGWILGSVLIGLSGAAPAQAGDWLGAEVFAGACAICHAAGSARVRSGQKPLPETRGIARAASPAAVIRIILAGREPAPERRGPMMPGFATILSDEDIAAVLSWLRGQAHAPGWPDLMRQVAVERAALGRVGGEARQ